MDKVTQFEKELAFIKNPKIREFAEKAIDSLPDYFFSIPSSSTNKYHPQFALGDAGLVRHSRACARLALEFFRLDWYKTFTEDEKDLIIASLLIHDGYKNGLNFSNNYTIPDHPAVLVNQLKENWDIQELISEEYFKIICDNVLCHMGQWRFGKDGNELMPKPVTQMQKLVHIIDYICSRRCLEHNFDVGLSRD